MYLKNTELVNFRIGKALSSHNPLLIKTIQMTDGPVMELGAGVFSTPLIHWLCFNAGRRIVTYEDNEGYYNFARGFRSRHHSIRMTKDWKDLPTHIHWSVVLIDNTTENRAPCAIQLKDCADFIILHDSEAPEVYHYDQVYPHFKYIYHWKETKPWVTVLSNFKTLPEK